MISLRQRSLMPAASIPPRRVALATLLCLAVAPALVGSGGWLPEEVEASIKKRVDYRLNQSIVIGLADKNGARYYSQGTAKIGGKPVDENTVYEIGSITKTLTSLLMVDMARKGELSLDDPIEKYLPEGVKVPSRGGTSIKLAHLATHTSGLPRMPDNFKPADRENPFADYTVEQLYEFLGSVELPRDVGAELRYSNVGVGLLGHILSLRGGASFEKLVHDRILTELGMNSTGVSLTGAMKRRLATGYRHGAQASNWDFPTLGGAGALRSTASDMVRYVSANMGLTRTRLYPAMQQTHAARPETKPMGLGWGYMGEGPKIIWHHGGTGGYRSFAGFLADGTKGVVILSNSTTSVDDIGLHLLDPGNELEPVKRSVVQALRPFVDKQGVTAAIAEYHRLKASESGEYDFGEGVLNSIGKDLLERDHVDDALEVFKLNLNEYPESFIVYSSLGDAYKEKGNNELAIQNYRKSFDLYPGHTQAIEKLAKLGVKIEPPGVDVPEAVLKRYVGRYQLEPDFIIVITLEGGKLKGNANQQGEFDMFPLSQTRFYLKVAPAQFTFNVNAEGKVESLTVHEDGNQEAPRIE